MQRLQDGRPTRLPDQNDQALGRLDGNGIIGCGVISVFLVRVLIFLAFGKVLSPVSKLSSSPKPARAMLCQQLGACARASQSATRRKA